MDIQAGQEKIIGPCTESTSSAAHTLTSVGKQSSYAPITLEAHNLVFGNREHDYGHPAQDFDTFAAYLTTYLRSRNLLAEGKEVIGEDVFPIMNFCKLSRYANGINVGKPKRDTNVDVAGYAEAGWRVIDSRENNS